MKKHIKALLLVLFLLVTTFSVAVSPYNTDPPELTTIDIRGILDATAGPNDIEAYVDGDFLYVSFHRSFGNVSITLYNPNNLIIYSGVVNTAIQQLLVIPVSLNDEGIYTIVLENATGYADGDFEIQP